MYNFIEAKNLDIGLMEPSRINVNTFKHNKQTAIDYMAQTMVKHNNKRFIMAPYYQL